MRTRLAAFVLAAAFCAGLAVAAGEPAGLGQPLVLRGAVSPSPLLGLRYGRLDTWLVRLEPRTLNTLPGRKLALGRDTMGWSFSPDRSRLVIGSEPSSLNDSPAALKIVDARTLTTLRDVWLGVNGFVGATHWVGADRVQALVRSSSPEADSVLLVDAAEGRVLENQPLEGSVGSIARAKGAFVLLLEPAPYGPVRLAVVDAAGALRTVQLDRIHAGRSLTEPPNSIYQHDRAGLAADADAGRGYVVAAGAPIAEVDIANLGVTYHAPAQPVSLLGRLRDWVEPRAQAKEILTRSARSAVWLGDGRLAVVGANGTPRWKNGRLSVKNVPSGLQVIDTRDWSSRIVDRQSSDLEVARNALLSWGLTWDSGKGTEQGTGLTVFGSRGQKRFHLFGTQPVFGAQVVNGQAFVTRPTLEHGYAIVSLRTGRIVRTVRGRHVPVVLNGSGSGFYG
jgi:hypothetical protein